MHLLASTVTICAFVPVKQVNCVPLYSGALAGDFLGRKHACENAAKNAARPVNAKGVERIVIPKPVLGLRGQEALMLDSCFTSCLPHALLVLYLMLYLMLYSCVTCAAKKHTGPASSPMKNAPVKSTEPAAGVMATSPAYASIRQHTPAYASIWQHTSAYVSIRQHTPA